MTISKAKLDELRLAGHLLSNACFNLSHGHASASLTDEDKSRLAELVRKWDAVERSTYSADKASGGGE